MMGAGAVLYHFDDVCMSLKTWMREHNRLPGKDDVECYPSILPKPLEGKTQENFLEILLKSFEIHYKKATSVQYSYESVKDLLFDQIMLYVESNVEDKPIHALIYHHIQTHPTHASFLLKHNQSLLRSMLQQSRCEGERPRPHTLKQTFLESWSLPIMFQGLFTWTVYTWIHDPTADNNATIVFLDQTLEGLVRFL